MRNSVLIFILSVFSIQASAQWQFKLAPSVDYTSNFYIGAFAKGDQYSNKAKDISFTVPALSSGSSLKYKLGLFDFTQSKVNYFNVYYFSSEHQYQFKSIENTQFGLEGSFDVKRFGLLKVNALAGVGYFSMDMAEMGTLDGGNTLVPIRLKGTLLSGGLSSEVFITKDINVTAGYLLNYHALPSVLIDGRVKGGLGFPLLLSQSLSIGITYNL